MIRRRGRQGGRRALAGGVRGGSERGCDGENDEWVLRPNAADFGIVSLGPLADFWILPLASVSDFGIFVSGPSSAFSDFGSGPSGWFWDFVSGSSGRCLVSGLFGQFLNFIYETLCLI